VSGLCRNMELILNLRLKYMCEAERERESSCLREVLCIYRKAYVITMSSNIHLSNVHLV